MDKVLIIAEAGVNHNGDMDLARQLIDRAAEAGADIVKFQTFISTEMATKASPLAGYQTRSGSTSTDQLDLLSRLELSVDDHKLLKDHCAMRGIEFFSTAFDLKSLDLLFSLGFKRFKIPSGEITNLPLLRRIGSFRCHVLLSTGMATLGEIEDAIQVLETMGTERQKITVMHCSTEYPTAMEDVNLNAMNSIGKAFNVQVGYSDHTQGIEVPIAAVALGAKVIEKHFTLDRNLPGPDHRASLVPHELNLMTSCIRNIERAMGDGIKRPNPNEFKNKMVVRKSIVAREFISRGELFTEKNLTTKRPGTGISPMRWESVVGKIAKRDFQVDEIVEI